MYIWINKIRINDYKSPLFIIFSVTDKTWENPNVSFYRNLSWGQPSRTKACDKESITPCRHQNRLYWNTSDTDIALAWWEQDRQCNRSSHVAEQSSAPPRSDFSMNLWSYNNMIILKEQVCTVPKIKRINPDCLMLSDFKLLYEKTGSSLTRTWLTKCKRALLTWSWPWGWMASSTAAWTASALTSPRPVASWE